MREIRLREAVWTLAAVVLATSSAARADLKSEERNFGKLGYEGARALIASACSCDAAGNCKRKLSDAEFAKQFHGRESEMADALARNAPELAKKIAEMPAAERTGYGNKLESDYITSVLEPAEIQRWNRMVRSCIVINGAPPPAPPPDTKNDRAHDGSLSRHGTHDSVGDLDDGKLDEPGGIAWWVDACVAGANEAVKDHPLARPRCGCIGDYLRRSPPSIVRGFIDAKDVTSLPGVQKCSAWDGKGKTPYAVAGMRASVDVAAAYDRCRDHDGKNRKDATQYCNERVPRGASAAHGASVAPARAWPPARARTGSRRRGGRGRAWRRRDRRS